MIALSLVAMLAANTAVVLGALALTKLIGQGESRINWIIFFLIRFGLISVTILIAGMAGVLTTVWLGGVSLVAIFVLIRLKAHTHFHVLHVPIPRFLVVVLALVLARLIAQCWYFAPYNFDALSYHLPKVAEWTRAGAFTLEMGVDTHAPFPAGFELIETWWVVFLKHDVLIEMAGIEFLVLAFCSIYSLAGHVGVKHPWDWFAALVYVVTPGLQVTSTSCLNDGPVAGLLLATFALAQSRVPFALLTLPVCFGIGVKPTFGYALPGILLLLFLTRADKREAFASRPLLASLVLGSLFIGAFWYVRNLVWYGSPIYPVGGQGLIASTGELKIQFGPRFSSGISSIKDLIDNRVYDSRSGYGAFLIHIAGWGAAAFACGFSCLLLALRGSTAFRRLSGAFLLSLVCILTLVNHDRWCMRFVLFFPGILALAIGFIAQTYRETLLVCIPALIFQFMGTMVPAEKHFSDHLPELLRQPWRTRSMSEHSGIYLNPAAIAYFVHEPVHNRGEAYILYGPDYSRRVVYLRGKTAKDLAQEMKDQNVTVLFDGNRFSNMPDLLDECIRQGYLRSLGGRLYGVNSDGDQKK